MTDPHPDPALARLNARIARKGLARRILLVTPGEGALLLDAGGARRAEPGTAEADCTLTASAETFRGLMDGKLNPMAAVLTGRLKIAGDMGAAMALAKLLG